MATANHNLSNYDKTKLPNGKDFQIALVVSEWNAEITNSLQSGAIATLIDCGVPEHSIESQFVPGSFELIYGSKLMQQQNFDAIIAIGSVIKGETQHFEYVCQAVSQGIMQLNVQGETPVILCLLTDDNWQQSKDRSGGKHGNKGVEAAVTSLKMIELKRSKAK